MIRKYAVMLMSALSLLASTHSLGGAPINSRAPQMLSTASTLFLPVDVPPNAIAVKITKKESRKGNILITGVDELGLTQQIELPIEVDQKIALKQGDSLGITPNKAGVTIIHNSKPVLYIINPVHVEREHHEILKQ